MRVKILSVLSVMAVLFVLGGCASTYVYTPTGIVYHHDNKDNGTFWMTITKTNEDGSASAAALWFCESKDSPKCIQVKLVRCENGQECQINASQIYQSVLTP